MRNIIVVLAFGLIGLALALNGCGGGAQTPTASASAATPGSTIYKKYCVTCHGADGTMGLNGAANLKASVLAKEEAVKVITNGRKMMAPYKSILSAAEIDQVAEHVMTFRE